MTAKKRKMFLSFRAKVTLVMIGAMIFSAAASNFLIYQYALQAQFQQLRERLMVIAQIAALSVDSNISAKIPLNREGVETQAYKSVAEKLLAIKEVDRALKYIYVMARTDQDGVWQFIVDPDAAEFESRGVTSFPGDRYDASKFPEMLKAFDGPAADRSFQIDRWGVTLSGYAPVRDASGRVFAMIGVDMAADDVYFLQQKVHRREIAVVLIGIIVSALAGTFLSKKLSLRIEQLLEGTKRIAEEDFRHQIRISGRDEISELAHAFNIMSRRLFVSRKKTHKYFYRAMQSLVRILESKDEYTWGHSDRVTEYAGLIAREMNLSEDEIEILRDAARLHDIGKLAVPNTILNKKGRLTDEEWVIIKTHPAVGADILKSVIFDKQMLAVVRYHHERNDGTGYPDRLQGEDIGILTAIISVADAYDAMTSDRSYRKALSKEQALAELRTCKGAQFRPDVVEAFENVVS